MQVFKRKQLESKVDFYLGDRHQFACGKNDHRWYYTIDSEHFVGPYRKRILAERAYRNHNLEGHQVG